MSAALHDATSRDTRDVVRADDHVFGDRDARVTVVVYGNYECLQCRRAWPALAALPAAFGGAVRVVYRHFARPADFPHAEVAAWAAEAAGAQGQFAAMHEALYSGEPRLFPEALVARAESLGLDVERFVADLEAPATRARVRRDLDDGLAAAVRRTPTIFVDGERVDAVWDEDAVTAAVAAAVADR